MSSESCESGFFLFILKFFRRRLCVALFLADTGALDPRAGAGTPEDKRQGPQSAVPAHDVQRPAAIAVQLQRTRLLSLRELTVAGYGDTPIS